MSRAVRSMTSGALCSITLALLAVAAFDRGAGAQAQQAARTHPQGFITGTVQGAQGPEAGVWVIAETKDLPTNFIKIAAVSFCRSCRRRTTASGSEGTGSSIRRRSR